jgi:pimeloyl-ACP methyl ester carboxylesterase
LGLGRIAGIGAGLLVAGYAAVQAANEVIRRREDLDPEAIERPGGMFYVRGLGLHFLDRGHGPAVLLVHALGSSTFSFRHQIRPLSERFRVLALDLPGFGYSDRPEDLDLSHTAQAERLREFLDRMGVERAVVVGHSMGGGIAARLAAAHPERVERLILVGAIPPDRRRKLPLFQLIRPLLPVAMAWLMWDRRRLRRELERIVYDPSFVTEEIVEGYRRPLRLRGTAACLMKLIGDVRRDEPVPPASVSTRTLLLWGEADPVFPLRVAHRLHAEMPDARLEVIPRAGHMVLEEQPEACNEALLRFLSAPTPARPAVAP